ncbi:MAG TPA: ATP-binding protein, partial [bacterium]|nr:ATP-binding protein [bacterium]
MWIERKYSDIIKKAIKTFPVVLLTGPRQTGKTSLLRRLFPDFDYIALDIPSIAEKAEKNPELFLNDLKLPVIIDEIQYSPSLFRFLKYFIDKTNKKGQFILSGSHEFLLMHNISESLLDRCAILNLHSLSISEILEKFKVNEFEIILKGGYPELWANKKIDVDLWYSSYISSYLERDVRNILKVSNLREFERFLRALAFRTGQMLSYSDISREVGVAVSTVREWVSVLQTSKQIFILEPYYKNLGKRIVKTPKIYILDIGLALYLNGIRTKKQFLSSKILGNLWETFIIGEIYRQYNIKGIKPNFWFWQNQIGAEVDCVIDIGENYYLFEIKFSEIINENDFKGINTFTKMYGAENIVEANIICRTHNSFLYDKK